MIDYKIAIPSYKRPETIKKKTLRVLREYNIDPEKIKEIDVILLHAN